jgi:hypothetical protein
MPVILATWEAEIRKTMIQNQPRQIVCETYLKNPITEKGSWSGSWRARGLGPEFKPQYTIKKILKIIFLNFYHLQFASFSVAFTTKLLENISNKYLLLKHLS